MKNIYCISGNFYMKLDLVKETPATISGSFSGGTIVFSKKTNICTKWIEDTGRVNKSPSTILVQQADYDAAPSNCKI